MNVMSLEFWNIVLDITVLCFCGFTVYFIARKRKNAPSEPVSRENPDQWDDALIRRLLQKKADPSFDQLLEVIKQKPELMLKNMPKPSETDPSIAALQPDVSMVVEPRVPKLKDGGAPPTPNAYNRVAEMARRGLSVKQISEKLRMPTGEIELVLKLKRGIPVAAMADNSRNLRTEYHPARS